MACRRVTAVVQNPDISKQLGALPPRRRTRLCLQLPDSPVRFPYLSPIGAKLAGVSSALEFLRICKTQMPAAPAFWPRMLGTRAASRLARHSAGKKLEPRPSGRHPDKHKMGGARLLEHGWGGLSDVYEPYLLSGKCPGMSGFSMTAGESSYFRGSIYLVI